MNTWLLVPVKPFELAKSRLAHVLSPEARARLVHLLLHHTLQTAHATNRFANILVISRDHNVLKIARSLDATAASELGDGLNQALVQARRQADMAGAAATLILPADLPLVTVNDLYALLALGEAGAEMILSPSRDDGTNALFLRDRVEINFEFGPHSFRRHKRQAISLGYRLSIYSSSSLLFDLDRPADLESLQIHAASAGTLALQTDHATRSAFRDWAPSSPIGGPGLCPIPEC